MSLYAYLFDAQGQDRPVKLDGSLFDAIGDQQLLWIDIEAKEQSEVQTLTALMDFPASLLTVLYGSEGQQHGQLQSQPRPRLDMYSQCFHLNVQAVQGAARKRQWKRQWRRQQQHKGQGN